MATIRNIHDSISEQVRPINVCRQNGMTDTVWCREYGIVASNFYN